jgi:CRP-like cAMP-binding protein
VLLVADPTVSRKHCTIWRARDGPYFARDTSRNGIRLDGCRLVPNVEVELRPGQTLSLGSVYAFRLEGEHRDPAGLEQTGQATLGAPGSSIATVLVGDIRNYTTLVRRAPADRLQQSVNRVFDLLQAVVTGHRGTPPIPWTSLSKPVLPAVAAAMRPACYAAGDVIIRQGEPGRHLHVLTRGEADVRVHIADGRSISVSTMKAGACFGEMSLLSGDPTSADVVATTECVTLALDRSAFDALVAAQPALLREFVRMVSKRLRDSNVAVGAAQQKEKSLTRFLQDAGARPAGAVRRSREGGPADGPAGGIADSDGGAPTRRPGGSRPAGPSLARAPRLLGDGTPRGRGGSAAGRTLEAGAPVRTWRGRRRGRPILGAGDGVGAGRRRGLCLLPPGVHPRVRSRARRGRGRRRRWPVRLGGPAAADAGGGLRRGAGDDGRRAVEAAALPR